MRETFVKIFRRQASTALLFQGKIEIKRFEIDLILKNNTYRTTKCKKTFSNKKRRSREHKT
jgi:hypothetical protein